MDVLIRGVKRVHIAEIDRKAAVLSDKLGRKFSRNEYLLMLIEQDHDLRLLQLKEDKFDRAVENLTATLDRQDSTLRELIKIILEERG